MPTLKYGSLYIYTIAFDAPTFLLHKTASKKYGSLRRAGSWPALLLYRPNQRKTNVK